MAFATQTLVTVDAIFNNRLVNMAKNSPISAVPVAAGAAGTIAYFFNPICLFAASNPVTIGAAITGGLGAYIYMKHKQRRITLDKLMHQNECPQIKERMIEIKTLFLHLMETSGDNCDEKFHKEFGQSLQKLQQICGQYGMEETFDHFLVSLRAKFKCSFCHEFIENLEDVCICEIFEKKGKVNEWHCHCRRSNRRCCHS